MTKIYRGFHYTVEDRLNRLQSQREHRPFLGAFLSKVISGDGDSERVKVDSVVGSNTTSFAYPFASRSAWIRGQPESTTTMISIVGSDTMDVQAVGYFDPGKSTAAAQYRATADSVRQQPLEPVQAQILPYRSLQPGELDIGSLFSQTFLGKGDVHQSRGGLTHLTMTSQSAKVETPLFEVKGHAHKVTSELVDEMRFGTVRRAVPNTAASPTKQELVTVADETNSRGDNTPVFAKEWTVSLDWFGTPGKLIDHRQGIVVEDDGELAQSRQTQKRLRARWKWHTEGDETYAEVDENGNTALLLSDRATEGLAMAVPGGNVTVSVGGRESLQQGGGKVQVQATNDVELSTEGQFKVATREDLGIQAQGRGEVSVARGLTIRSDGIINVDAAPLSGIALGNRDKDKYPVLVAQPEYISTLNEYFSGQTGLAGALSTYGATAATAWAAVGPLLMLLDPSGVVMGLCQSAGAAAGQIAAQAPQVSAAIGRHLPRLSQMPAGFMSSKTVSE